MRREGRREEERESNLNASRHPSRFRTFAFVLKTQHRRVIRAWETAICRRSSVEKIAVFQGTDSLASWHWASGPWYGAIKNFLDADD